MVICRCFLPVLILFDENYLLVDAFQLGNQMNYDPKILRKIHTVNIFSDLIHTSHAVLKKHSHVHVALHNFEYRFVFF
jgi:hypothetical protein